MLREQISAGGRKPLRIYYSYAPEDARLQKELRRSLAALYREGFLVDAGGRRAQPRSAQWQDGGPFLLEADIILLLVSSSFIDSDACYKKEMVAALSRQRDGAARLLPVILRPVALGATPLQERRCLPANGVPVVLWRPRDGAWREVAQAILAIAQEWAPPTAETAAPPASSEPPQPPTAGRYSALVEGLPEPARGHIKGLIGHYIGTPAQPVPFGGREQDLAEIRCWVNDDDQAPCMLLTAPAGRGKTALLCELCLRLSAQPDLDLLFYPFSIRFETSPASSFFQTVLARLAEFHGRQETPSTSPHEWGWRLREALSQPPADGRRLLVVLDGLDEATGLSETRTLLPQELPDGVKILVSARRLAGEVDGRGWRDRLGWEAVGRVKERSLDQLPATGISEVLKSVRRYPHHLPESERSQVVVQMHRLSQGDPLLLYLWLDLLAVEELRPEALRELKDDGIAAYVGEWWRRRQHGSEEQAQVADHRVRLVLRLLACALGPLSRVDLLQLAQTEVPSSSALDAIFRSLGRFVIGDGRKVGYVFSHSRMRDYFHEEVMEQEERRRYSERYELYGRRTVDALNKERLSPKDASSYVVRHYGAHLWEAQEHGTAAVADFMTLCTPAWQQAWEAVDPGGMGFLIDVDRAWQAVARIDRERAEAGASLLSGLSDELYCALCTGSVYSLMGNIPVDMLGLLVQHRIEGWGPAQALAWIRRMPFQGGMEHAKDAALGALLPHLPDDIPLLREVLELVFDIWSRTWWDPHNQMLAVIGRFVGGLREELLASAARLQPPERAKLLAEVALHLPPAERAPLIEEAERTARSVEDMILQVDVLLSVAERLPEDAPQKGSLRQAAQVALEGIAHLYQSPEKTTRWQREQVSWRLRWLLPRVSEGLRDALFRRTLLVTCATGEHEGRAALELLDVLPDATQREAVAQILSSAVGMQAILLWLGGSNQRIYLDCDPDKGRRLAALLSTEQLERVVDRVFVEMRAPGGFHDWTTNSLGSLAAILSPSQQREAMAVVTAMSDPSWMGWGLVALAPYVSEDLLLDVLTAALFVAEAPREPALFAVLRRLPTDRLVEARELVVRSAPSEVKVYGLLLLALRQERPEDRDELLERARQVALHIEDAGARAVMLSKLSGVATAPPEHTKGPKLTLPELPEAFCRAVLIDVIEAAFRLPVEARADFLVHWHASLPTDSSARPEVLRQALRAASQLSNPSGVLRWLIPYMDGEAQRKALSEIITAARRIEDGEAQFLAAGALATTADAQLSLLGMIERKIPDPIGKLRILLKGILPRAVVPAVREETLRKATAVLLSLPNRTLVREHAWVSELVDQLLPEIQCEEQAKVVALLFSVVEELYAERGTKIRSPGYSLDGLHLDRESKEIYCWRDLLAHLAPYLSTAQRAAALEMTPPSWIDLHSTLMRHLPQPKRAQWARQILSEMPGERDREQAEVLAELAGHLPDEERGVLVRRALAAAGDVHYAMMHTSNRTQVLGTLAPYLAVGHLDEIVRLVKADWQQNHIAFLDFVGRLPREARERAVRALVELAKQGGERWWKQTLVSLAEWVPDEWYDLTLEAFLEASGTDHLLRLVAGRVERLSEAQLVRAFEVSQQTHFVSNDLQVNAQVFCASELARRSPRHFSKGWTVLHQVLRESCQSGRSRVLYALPKLAPLLSILFREGDALAHLIEEVSRQWP